VVAVLFAEHDTPLVALTYSWQLLDDHPDVRDALLYEYHDVGADDRPPVQDPRIGPR